MQKLSHKSRVMLYKRCGVLHKETNKIGFAFFWFFLEFLHILQVTGQGTHKGKKLFTHRSLETFKPSQLCPRANNPYNQVPDVPGEFAAGDVEPGQVNKWYGASIGHTTDLLVEVVRPETSSTSGGGESVAARPPRPEVRQGAGRCEAMCCGTSFKGS
jgi:hypothetical protein